MRASEIRICETHALIFKHARKSFLQRALHFAGVPLSLRARERNVRNDAARVDLRKLAAAGGCAEAVTDDAAAVGNEIDRELASVDVVAGLCWLRAACRATVGFDLLCEAKRVV
jgi:hypothetical protein